MPKKLVKLDHGDPTINRIQRHVEDAFASVHQALSSASLVTNVTSSLDERFDVRYLLTSSATPQAVTSSFQISGSVAITGTLNAQGSVNVSSSLVVVGNTVMSGTGAVRRLGVGMLADANIPLCVSSSNFTGIYLLASGTRCALELDARTVGSQSVVQFDEAGTQKFLIGKQTDNTFILYDATRNKNPFAYAPSTNVLTLQNADGRVGIGTGAPATNLEVSSGSISGSVGIRVANTSATASSAYINLSTGIRAFTITSDQNGNLAFNDDTAGNRAFLRGSDGLFLINNSAYVGTNLGIGTASPAQKLHVLGGDVLISHGADNGSAAIQIYNSSTLNPASYLDLNTGLRSYRLYNNPAGTFGVYDNNAGSYRLKVDNSGRLGVGSSDPTVFMHIQGDTLVAGSASISATSPSLAIRSTAAAASFPTAYMELSSALKTWRIYNNSSNEFGIFDASPGIGAYRLKIDTNGQVGIGTTPSDLFHVNGIMRSQGNRCCQGTAGSPTSNTFNFYWTGAALQAWVDTTNVGTVSLTSDRRLKQMIRTVTGSALAAIAQLRPVAYRWQNTGIWRDDGQDRLGFIADELQKVIPSAVNGIPSGSDYQSLNYGDIIAVQAKAIQELSASNASMAAQITSLQASLAALSGTVSSLLKPSKPI
jgi:hypothetical protein